VCTAGAGLACASLPVVQRAQWLQMKAEASAGAEQVPRRLPMPRVSRVAADAYRRCTGAAAVAACRSASRRGQPGRHRDTELLEELHGAPASCSDRDGIAC
jgi:hypothetical protein